jgi:short-subunit dehydrogenase
MAKRSLSNRRILLTGASSGIGRELARQLAAQRSRLVVVARRENRLRELADTVISAGSECVAIVGDITLAETRAAAIEACQSEFGGLDILINNAGVGAMGPFSTAQHDRLRRIFEVNFFAAAELLRSAIPILLNGIDPLVVNIGSVLGYRAVPHKSEYCASKFAIRALTDSLRAELRNDGIEFLLVSPSTTDTEFFSSAIEDSTGIDWTRRGAMTSEQVAKKTIIAMVHRKREIVLSFGGKALVWMERLFPSVVDRMVSRLS